MIRKQMLDTVKHEAAGLVFYRGRIGKREIVLAKCGVGKVNAAICAQLMLERYKVERIVFTGVAGALDPDLVVGDVVISVDCMYHDMDATALGFVRGEIPYADQSLFAADPLLLALAAQAVERQGKKPIRGRVLSGDQFIADRLMVQHLYTQLHGTCTEMEGAAVAHVCAMHGTPFVIVRSISDKADGSASVNFLAFTKMAAAQSAAVVLEMMQLLDTVDSTQ